VLDVFVEGPVCVEVGAGAERAELEDGLGAAQSRVLCHFSIERFLRLIAWVDFPLNCVTRARARDIRHPSWP